MLHRLHGREHEANGECLILYLEQNRMLLQPKQWHDAPSIYLFMNFQHLFNYTYAI